MICKAKKALKIGSKVYPKNSLLNLPEDKAQILLNKNLIQPVTYEELHQALTEELKEDSRINNSRGILVKFNILDDTIALTTPGYLEEVKKQGFVTYLPSEVISLLVAEPKALQLICEIKKVFDGRIKSAPAEDMKRKWQ